MMRKVTFKRLLIAGEYLGFCEDKGYLYSIFLDYNNRGDAVFGIYSVRGHVLEQLIEYSVWKENEK